MKKIIFMFFIWSFMYVNVSAETHDVQAKYEKSYNVDLVTTNISNETKVINIDNYSLEFSTKLKDIDIVIIKAENDANNYIKQYTQSSINYYLGFFKNDNKISNSDITIKIKNNNKVLNIYDNKGYILNTSNESINLNNNDYFITITDKLDDNKDEYKIVDLNTLANNLESVENNTAITVYNYKNILIDNNKPLGTGYKVILNNGGVIDTYKIVVKGDITGDSKINLNDITRLYHYYKKIEEMDTPFILAGDVASNNIINLNDITKIYHYYKKIISSL